MVQYRLEAEYGVTTRLQPLDYRMALRVEGEPDAHEKMWIPGSAVPTRDRDGRTVVLFSGPYELESCRKNNPDLRFVPMS